MDQDPDKPPEGESFRAKPRPPQPPSSIPPVPPPPELLRATVPHVPLTPMMDFFQRRLDSLEKELTLEREKARSAQSLIQQQEGMRAEVEAQLKSLTDSLRREKAEKDTEETKAHARGRIDALERRLDETQQAFVSLLKEAIAKPQAEMSKGQSEISKEQSALGAGQTALRQELTVLSAAVNGLMEQVAQWRSDSQGLAQLAPEVRALAKQVPSDGRRLEGQLAQQLSQFSSEFRERFAEWERRQDLESQKARERVEALGREKAALMRAWEDQNHELRQQALKDKISREGEVAGHMAELAKRVDEIKQDQGAIARGVETLAATPKAKDAVIQALEREKSDFALALHERSEALRRYALERADIEKTLGESLLRMQGEVE